MTDPLAKQQVVAWIRVYNSQIPALFDSLCSQFSKKAFAAVIDAAMDLGYFREVRCMDLAGHEPGNFVANSRLIADAVNLMDRLIDIGHPHIVRAERLWLDRSDIGRPLVKQRAGIGEYPFLRWTGTLGVHPFAAL